MEKNNKIFLIIISICTILVIGICAWSIFNHEAKTKKENVTDSTKFISEYNELNGVESKEPGSIYPTVSIPENNTVKYVNENEAIDIIKNGSGVVYFGFAACPWCRNMITPLVTIAKETHVNIYYLDILELRSKYEIVNNELKKTADGTKGYYEILNLLADRLDNYVVSDEDNKMHETGEKRLFAPTTVAVQNGKITDFHVGTVKSHESGFDKLTKKQETELNKRITELVKNASSNSCESTGC